MQSLARCWILGSSLGHAIGILCITRGERDVATQGRGDEKVR